VASVISPRSPIPAGHASITFRRAGARTVLAEALAASPLRLLTPRNHGKGAWAYLATLGGGMVDGDCIDVRIVAAEGTTALVGTQASTKVYRSPRGCSQKLAVDVAPEAAVALVPDPVVCFAGAHYCQQIAVSVAPGGSLLLLDGYTCGRSARGERWDFASFSSRTTVTRDGVRAFVDATRLDAAHGRISERMGRFDVVLSLVALGPRFAGVRAAMLRAPASVPFSKAAPTTAVSPFGTDGALVRVAAECFESASRSLHASFAELAALLGDDPFARKW